MSTVLDLLAKEGYLNANEKAQLFDIVTKAMFLRAGGEKMSFTYAELYTAAEFEMVMTQSANGIDLRKEEH